MGGGVWGEWMHALANYLPSKGKRSFWYIYRKIESTSEGKLVPKTQITQHFNLFYLLKNVSK